MKPMILMIDDNQAQVVLDALVRHAYACEAEGDALNEVDTADELAEQIRGLQSVADEAVTQMLRSVGLGRARGCPQG